MDAERERMVVEAEKPFLIFARNLFRRVHACLLQEEDRGGDPPVACREFII